MTAPWHYVFARRAVFCSYSSRLRMPSRNGETAVQARSPFFQILPLGSSEQRVATSQAYFTGLKGLPSICPFADLAPMPNSRTDELAYLPKNGLQYPRRRRTGPAVDKQLMHVKQATAEQVEEHQ